MLQSCEKLRIRWRPISTLKLGYRSTHASVSNVSKLLKTLMNQPLSLAFCAHEVRLNTGENYSCSEGNKKLPDTY